MEKVRGTTAYLTPDQVPDNTVDQPIYALAKQVQWQCPEQFRMEKIVTMFGGLYIARSLGTLLKGRCTGKGWRGFIWDN